MQVFYYLQCPAQHVHSCHQGISAVFPVNSQEVELDCLKGVRSGHLDEEVAGVGCSPEGLIEGWYHCSWHSKGKRLLGKDCSV